MRLKDKVCIVTGAGSGIGKATATLFGRSGASVVVADINSDTAQVTADNVVGAGGRAVVCPVDVTDEKATQLLADRTINEFGRIDVLFNNAGISAAAQVHETSLELWDRIMRINVQGVFLMAKAVLPSMIARRAGSIINMSSIIATTGLPNRAAYAASKGAILALTKSMQVDYGPAGIRVNALMPGTIFTPMVDRVLKESFPTMEEARVAIRRRQLTDELGLPVDVAQAALFLASDDARFVMGTGLVIDGGIMAGRR